jgi:hypothetical protein
MTIIPVTLEADIGGLPSEARVGKKHETLSSLNNREERNEKK